MTAKTTAKAAAKQAETETQKTGKSTEEVLNANVSWTQNDWAQSGEWVRPSGTESR
jgi:hypothetical protein